MWREAKAEVPSENWTVPCITRPTKKRKGVAEKANPTPCNETRRRRLLDMNRTLNLFDPVITI